MLRRWMRPVSKVWSVLSNRPRRSRSCSQPELWLEPAKRNSSFGEPWTWPFLHLPVPSTPSMPCWHRAQWASDRADRLSLSQGGLGLRGKGGTGALHRPHAELTDGWSGSRRRRTGWPLCPTVHAPMRLCRGCRRTPPRLWRSHRSWNRLAMTVL